jgi:serine acetyltransferase
LKARAGSVLTHSVSACSTVVGVSARVIRQSNAAAPALTMDQSIPERAYDGSSWSI